MNKLLQILYISYTVELDSDVINNNDEWVTFGFDSNCVWGTCRNKDDWDKSW